MTTADEIPVEGADAVSDASEVRESPAIETDTQTPPTENPRAAAAITVGALVAVIAAGIGAVFFIGHRSGVSDTERNQDIMSVTRQVVGNLVTLRHQSADEDLKKITNATTGDFRKQFTDGGGSFATVLQQGAVESTGAAREVAIVRADDSSATTIAAVTSTVKNSDVPDGQARVYRMKLSLEKHDGRWLVSNVEFVA
jgi:Mce-associated membrane protein